jgi:hypothetical protein
MSDIFHTLTAGGIKVVVDLRAGHVRELVIERDGRTVEPLHTAPWVEDPAITGDESLPGNLRFLSGDFFCAPFSTSDVEPSPPHGWPANSPWGLVEVLRHEDGVTGRYELEKRVLGARVIKEFRLRDGHPFLYERHVFIGGTGAVPVANHAMTRFEHGGRLSFSPKRHAETLPKPLEGDPARGRSKLAYFARFEDTTRAPMADGTFADLTHYPIGQRHEDFVMLVEAEGQDLGWLCAARPDKRDVFISLKNPATYPVTFLWFSNGGRDYAPWNGRHLGVLGVEEGRSFSGNGHRASIEPNDLSRLGIPTALALDPDGAVEVRNVIGGVPVAAGFERVGELRASPGRIELVGSDGSRLAAPYDDAFLAASF